MKIAEIMTKKVVTLKPSDSLHAAIKTFAKKGISGAPVVSRGKVVGVVSDADLTEALDTATPSIRITSSKLFNLVFASLRSKKKEEQIKEEIKEAKKIKISSCMSGEPVTIGQDAGITDALKTMVSKKVTRLPVVNKKGKLVGIVARADLIRALSDKFC